MYLKMIKAVPFSLVVGKWTIFIEIPGSHRERTKKFEMVLCNMNILFSYVKLSFIEVNISQN